MIGPDLPWFDLQFFSLTLVQKQYPCNHFILHFQRSINKLKYSAIYCKTCFVLSGIAQLEATASVLNTYKAEEPKLWHSVG